MKLHFFKIFFVSIFIGNGTLIFCQHQFGFSLAPGISQFNNSADATNTNEKSVFRFSGKGGLFYSYSFSNIEIQTGIEFIQMEGKDILRMDLIDVNGNTSGSSTDFVFRHISYIGIPITFGYQFGETQPFLGYRYAFEIASSGVEAGYADFNGSRYEWENKYDDINTKPVDHGIILGVNYSLNNKWKLEFNFYAGLNNLFDGSPYLDWVWKNNQLTLGFSYNILKKKD